MAEYTENFNLKKPEQNDFYSIKDFNDNTDIIDAELKKLKDAIENLNIENITLPDGKTIAEKFEEIETEIGNIEELDTDTKTNVIAAINEIFQALAAHKSDNFHHIPYVIATGTNSYAVNIQGITALTEGMSVKIKFTNANTGASTLNINGLGEIPIKKSNGNDLSAGNIKAGQICHLVYTGSVFQLLGEGGEYGTAQPNHVLEGITFGTEDGLKVGTMPNRGAVTHTITTQGGTYTIPEGYHDGSGKVTANFANLIASNIKKGVNIGGVVGNMTVTSKSITWSPNYEFLAVSGQSWSRYATLQLPSGYDGALGILGNASSTYGGTVRVEHQRTSNDSYTLYDAASMMSFINTGDLFSSSVEISNSRFEGTFDLDKGTFRFRIYNIFSQPYNLKLVRIVMRAIF